MRHIKPGHHYLVRPLCYKYLTPYIQLSNTYTDQPLLQNITSTIPDFWLTISVNYIGKVIRLHSAPSLQLATPTHNLERKQLVAASLVRLAVALFDLVPSSMRRAASWVEPSKGQLLRLLHSDVNAINFRARGLSGTQMIIMWQYMLRLISWRFAIDCSDMLWKGTLICTVFLLLSPPARAVDRSNFKTCDQSSFCKCVNHMYLRCISSLTYNFAQIHSLFVLVLFFWGPVCNTTMYYTADFSHEPFILTRTLTSTTPDLELVVFITLLLHTAVGLASSSSGCFTLRSAFFLFAIDTLTSDCRLNNPLSLCGMNWSTQPSITFCVSMLYLSQRHVL